MTAARRRFERRTGIDLSGLDARQARRRMRRLFRRLNDLLDGDTR